MLSQRIRLRVTSARPIATGYIPHRRLAFHKRGRDGSGKADAVLTGQADDKVWGVVYSLDQIHKPVLDKFETGYDCQSVNVICADQKVAASVYVAQTDVIDTLLKPFCWYHRYVVEGAREHGLPVAYRRAVAAIEAITDHDQQRIVRNTVGA